MPSTGKRGPIPEGERSRLLWLQGEELQVDGIAHCFVTGIVRMEMIARVDVGQECVGMIGVPHRGFEVDETVDNAAGANPFVHGLADGFAFFGIVARAMIRRESAADHCYAVGVCS